MKFRFFFVSHGARISMMSWLSTAWLSSPYLLVAIGGAIGSVFRYGVGRLVSSWFSAASSIWATGLVNLVGSFALGCIVMSVGGSQRGHSMVLLFGVGLCGGFTTFSTMSMEVADLVHARRWELASSYAIASLFFGWLAFVLGAWLAGGFLRVGAGPSGS